MLEQTQRYIVNLAECLYAETLRRGYRASHTIIYCLALSITQIYDASKELKAAMPFIFNNIPPYNLGAALQHTTKFMLAACLIVRSECLIVTTECLSVTSGPSRVS